MATLELLEKIITQAPIEILNANDKSFIVSIKHYYRVFKDRAVVKEITFDKCALKFRGIPIFKMI